MFRSLIRMVVLGTLALCLVGVLGLPTHPATAQRIPREIAWRLEPGAGVRFTVTVHEDRPEFNTPPVADASLYQPRNRRWDWIVFGNRMNARGPLFGQPNAEHEGWTKLPPRRFEEMCDFVSFWLPDGRYRGGATFLCDQTFILKSPKSVLRVIGRYEVDRARGQRDPLTLRADLRFMPEVPSSANRAAPRSSECVEPEEAFMRLVVTYDRVRGTITEIDQQVRFYYPYTVPEPDEEGTIAPNPHSGWWHVTLTEEGGLPCDNPEVLQPRIDRAIERGVAAIRGGQQDDGSWDHYAHDVGMTALVLLALLASGVEKDDEAVVKGFAYLHANPPVYTYDAGLVCMAVEARGIPDDEWELAQDGDMPEEFDRDLSEGDRETLETAAQFIIDNRAEVANTHTERRMWSYPTPDTPGRFDHSVTQYAMLGLYSALRCGVDVPQEVWLAAAEHHLRAQEPDGEEVYRLLPPEDDDDGRRTDPRRSRISSHARGWAYTELRPIPSGTRPYPETRANGSMTAAGITSCVIARAGLMACGALTREMDNDLQQAIRDGLAWFQRFYDITQNVGHNERDSWYPYYLYGIERVGMLTGTEWFGTHHWYHEGAVILCLMQRDGGGWGQRYDTAFALLFLKRATLPMQQVFTEE